MARSKAPAPAVLATAAAVVASPVKPKVDRELIDAVLEKRRAVVEKTAEAQALVAGPQAEFNLAVARALASVLVSAETHVLCVKCGVALTRPPQGQPMMESCDCPPAQMR